MVPSLQPRWRTVEAATIATTGDSYWPYGNDSALLPDATFHHRAVLPEQVLMPITTTNEEDDDDDDDDDRQQLPNLLPTWQGIIVRNTQPRPALGVQDSNRHSDHGEEGSLASSCNTCTMHLVTPTRQDAASSVHDNSSSASSSSSLSSSCCYPPSSAFVWSNAQVVEHVTVPDLSQYPQLLAPQE